MLSRLRELGVFLVDLKPEPGDRRPLHALVPDLVGRVRDLDPEAVILIKATVYDAAFSVLRREGLPVVDERIPPRKWAAEAIPGGNGAGARRGVIPSDLMVLPVGRRGWPR